jgi:hypothetical protein
MFDAAGNEQQRPGADLTRRVTGLPAAAQLAAADVVLDQSVLDRIDEIVAPGVTVNPVDNSFHNTDLEPGARRR